MSLDGKVAIITGGSRGIGKAIAHSFCQAGAHIMICSRSANSINQTAETLVSQGYSALGIQADVSSKSDVEVLVEKTLSEFGQVDILINNAGITRDTLLMRMKDDDWETVI
ncbi:TPA: SDR family NAD(P)-dependent oxidoreductase, partial [Candidatus Poribacteria bacterium]|nr:SDR family NAD(P)-dependent oxidoreductase [Candidatus Poribacteria bacterium]